MGILYQNHRVCQGKNKLFFVCPAFLGKRADPAAILPAGFVEVVHSDALFRPLPAAPRFSPFRA